MKIMYTYTGVIVVLAICIGMSYWVIKLIL